jgi:hypothetical protein
MSKTVKYAKDGAIILGLGNVLLNAINQIAEIKHNKGQKFDWQALLIAGGKGALVGGTIGGGIGLITDINYTNSKPINAAAVLSIIAKDVTLDKSDPFYLWLNKKAIKIENFLREEFKHNVQEDIVRLGSTEDGTALNYKFDIDLGISFKKEVFASTRDMYESLYDSIERKFVDQSLVKVRRQKKSLGLIFEHKGEKLKIDVVPIKMSSPKGTSGYMYLNNNSLFTSNSYKKTDISLLKSAQLTPHQKKVYMVLKNWKQKEGIRLSSHFLKTLVYKAFNDFGVTQSRDLAKSVVRVSDFISKTILELDFSSVENTNNKLSQFDEDTKWEIKKAFDGLIKEYDYHPNAFVSLLDV